MGKPIKYIQPGDAPVVIRGVSKGDIMTQRTNSVKILRMVQLAVLTAIMILLEVTGLGLIKIGVVEMTILIIPVIIGAIVLGKSAGAFLGGVFGLLSFLECFGKSAFGATLLGINPIFTALMCFVPRILSGFLAGLTYEALKKIDKTKVISYAVAGLAGALSNTVFFLVLLIVLFGSTEFIQGLMEMLGSFNPFVFGVLFVGVNGLIEAITCTVLGAAVAKVLVKTIPANKSVESVQVKTAEEE